MGLALPSASGNAPELHHFTGTFQKFCARNYDFTLISRALRYGTC